MAIKQDKLDEFLVKFVADFGATFNAGMVVIGDKLGLYKALAVKPMNSTELALATGTDERDCLHDMGDPVGASRHVREALKPEGARMTVEPYANDKLEDNLNPVGCIFYSASTLICTPASRAQAGCMCLGAQPGESNLRAVVSQGGFTHFRRHRNAVKSGVRSTALIANQPQRSQPCPLSPDAKFSAAPSWPA